jgi:hypothetical protein
LAAPAYGSEYVQVFDFATINPAAGGSGLFGVGNIGGEFIFTTAFATSGTNDIIKTPGFTTVVSNLDINFLSTRTNGIDANQFYANSPTTSIFVDRNSDSIYTLDLANNSLTLEKSNADIISFTGLTSTSQQIDQGVLDASGNLLFYNGTTDSILSLSTSGTLSTFATDAELISGIGTDIIRSMSIDAANERLFIGSTSTDEVSVLDFSGASNSYSTVVSKADLIAFTGETATGPNNMLYAPDGLLYIYESTSDSIISLDPDNPLGTLTTVIDEAALLDGPGGSDVIGGLVWIDDNIGWYISSTRNDSVAGVYAIPEPSSLALLGLGGLLAMRRRRGGSAN